MSNDIEWGECVLKMTIFFDNVRDIPEKRQQGKLMLVLLPKPRVMV